MSGGMHYKQRDIVFVPFPYSDLSGVKKRPALIISNEKMQKHQDMICCIITSNPTTEGVLIENNCFEEGNLPYKSWVKPYRIFTINKGMIIRKLAVINNRFYKKVFDGVCSYLR